VVAARAEDFSMSRARWQSVVGLAAGCAALGSACNAWAFKIGYGGVPIFVSNFPAVHEATTAEAARHVCTTMGVAAFRASRFFGALLDAPLASCDDLAFDPSTGKWREQVAKSPIQDLVLGAPAKRRGRVLKRPFSLETTP
jgi:hypothetical protein